MYIELHDSARDHPKIIRAAKRLGVSKVHMLGHMASLWLWTLRMAPDGNLSSFEPEDIETGAEWEGGAGVFVGVLESVKLLDCHVTSCDVTGQPAYIIHDWSETAAHLKAAERKRKERARKQSLTRITPKDVTGRHVTSRDVTMNETKERTEREERSEKKDLNPVSLAKARSTKVEGRKAQALEIFEHYRTYHPPAHPKPSSKGKEWKAIVARLTEGYSVDDLKRAIDGCHMSPFHQGENERGKCYDSLGLIMRDSDHVTSFIEETTKDPNELRRKAPKDRNYLDVSMELMEKYRNEEDQRGRSGEIVDATPRALQPHADGPPPMGSDDD